MSGLDDLDDVYRDPNGPAYQTREARVGPPLAYVAEKLGAALGDLHRAAHADRRAGAGVGPELRSAFLHALVAYLALGNMLALAEDPGALTERLLAISREEFDDWRWRVSQESSVTG